MRGGGAQRGRGTGSETRLGLKPDGFRQQSFEPSPHGHGLQGDPGLSGATIRDWKIDRARYVATPVMSDGSEGPRLELRGLF